MENQEKPNQEQDNSPLELGKEMAEKEKGLSKEVKKEILNEEWMEHLIEECQAIMTERGFNARNTNNRLLKI